MIGTSQTPWIKIVFGFLLLVVLPIFVWAVATQRIELRKRAATSEPVEICWNRVITFNNAYHWPDSCKGSPRTDLVCSEVLIPLTADEINGYDQWYAMGQPYIPGCSGTAPTITPPAAITCDWLADIQSQYFAQCQRAGYPKICFDKFTGEYEGCTRTDEECTVDNMYAERHMSCDSSMAPPLIPECGACSQTSYCASELVCQPIPTPTPNCPYGASGPCSVPAGYPRQVCVKPDGSSRCPAVTPTPTQNCTTNADCPSGYVCSSVPPGGCPIVNGVPVRCATAPRCYPASTPTPTRCGPNGSSCTITICTTPPPCTTFGACQSGVCNIRRGICRDNRCVPVFPTPYQSPTPTSYQSPTPTPATTTPPPRGNIADLTNEGDTPGNQVNEYDYNVLVGEFGKTGTPGWIKADIIKNGKVDEFDYNALVENFGK